MTATSTKASEVLAAAANLIEPPGAWTRCAYARGAHGEPATASAQHATCWCAVGAIKRIVPKKGEWLQAVNYLDKIVGTIVLFNDALDRTQAEVVAALREASTLAAQEGN